MENLILSVAGMHTATCADKIEKTLSSTKGITSVAVNFSSEKATVTFDEHVLTEKKILKIIEKLGYKCQKKIEENEQQRKIKQESKKWLSRLIITTILTIITFSIPGIYALNQGILATTQNPLILLLISITIYFGFFSVLKNVYLNIINLKITSDFLPSLALIVLYLYTLILTILPGLSFYVNRIFIYQSLILITLTLTFTKWLQIKFDYKIKENYQNLNNLQPKKARVIRHNTEMEVDVDTVKVGDLLKVHPGEAFPVDGIIVEGETKINGTILTGYEGAVEKKSGDEVIAATINIQNTIIFKATQVGKETTLSQVISLIDDTKKHKGRYEKASKKFEIAFEVIALILALGSFVFWLYIGEKSWVFTGIMSFVSVLLIANPTGFVFGIITPYAIGIEKAALKGIIYKGSETIEITSRLKKVIIDKTGIITRGIPEITNVVNKDGFNEKRFLILIGSLENASTHPFADAIVEFCKDQGIAFKKAYDFKNLEGLGVMGMVDGQEVIAGNMKLMEKSNVQMNKELLHKAEILAKNVRSPVFVAKNRELIGIIGIADTIKDNAKIAVSDLIKQGLEVTLVTGDNERIAQHIADELRIKEVFADIQQKEKIETVQNLQEKGPVAFVGEGINDGPVLAQADIGIALNAGTDAALAASDITCLSDDLRKINESYILAKSIKKIVAQNVLIALMFNVIALPIAFGALFPITHLMIYPALAPVFSGMVLAALMGNSSKSMT